ncbi:Uncharacterised protein [Legionella wadsworthii]|uniref:Uncharacterized protein n=1 Tax=Legionella wadsworthii TaxID=28088 RepID=A0A378LRQ6_9GAMM|nr:hypothetical protein [Legionella wadsworthii]STY29397.1 Uncharacterised protein [Legionella wadsworthii]
MLAKREELYNQIGKALNPEDNLTIKDRMNLLFSALYELDETTRNKGDEAYTKDLYESVIDEVKNATDLAMKDPDNAEKREKDIESKERVKAVRKKENEITANLIDMIKKTANSNNEAINAVRSVLTAVMRNPEYYGFSSKMRPVLNKLYQDISIIPKHAIPGEEERTKKYLEEYLNIKMNSSRAMFTSEISYYFTLKLNRIFNKFEETVEKNVLILFSQRQGMTQDDIPNHLIAENSKASLSDYLNCSNRLLENRPELQEQYNALKYEERLKQAPKTLQEIKLYIETTPWELGKWGSKSKITVEGKEKAVPNHINQIYEKILFAQKNPNEALNTLKEIHEISQKALKDKPVLFSSFRERFRSTTRAYEEIEQKSRGMKL